MRADVFQAVALCCHSNAYLAGARERTPEMLSNSTFLPAHEVLFERAGGAKWASGVVADATGPWLKRLEKEGVERLSLSLIGCPLDPLTAAAEPWGIRSDSDIGVEIWQPEWKKRIRNHSDLSPWRVTYTATRSNRWAVNQAFELAETMKLLTSAISQCATEHFVLTGIEHAKSNPYPDLYPAGWPSKQRELGELGSRAAAVVRSEEWAQVVLRREMTAVNHQMLSQKLWRAAIMALEASARIEESASAHPTPHSFPLAS